MRGASLKCGREIYTLSLKMFIYTQQVRCAYLVCESIVSGGAPRVARAQSVCRSCRFRGQNRGMWGGDRPCGCKHRATLRTSADKQARGTGDDAVTRWARPAAAMIFLLFLFLAQSALLHPAAQPRTSFLKTRKGPRF